jgi:ubiquinone/menaquinone biosynthesis C-methylase UbiE
MERVMILILCCGIWLLVTCATIARIVLYATATPCEESLNEDLAAVHSVYEPPIHFFRSKDVEEYYEATTARDYRWLQWVVGPGMHTILSAPSPISYQGRGTRQAALVLAEVRAIGAQRVLEIGCGRGFCTLFLAGAAPDVKFEGVDLLAQHIQTARTTAAAGGLCNATFHVADANVMKRTHQMYDLIFGCEALNYVGADTFFRRLARPLRPGGRLVVIDGFRSRTFNTCHENQQRAMILAESAFHINAMHSKGRWIRRGKAAGFNLIRNIDLTKEAEPFWTLGWRLVRYFLCFPNALRWYMGTHPHRTKTVENLVAICMVSHALRNRAAAEYGMLVLGKWC